ncbi:MAG: DUF2807 domain-containing protein [Acidobacteriota bacterium]|nr:DUF2807 domain-containing protein [Acidobacteriota bacterium]
MKIRTLAIAAALLAEMSLGAGCCVYRMDAIRGSGKIATETREISSFESLVVTGAADVELSIGEPLSLWIEADDNLLPLVTTDVRGERLVVSSRGSYSTRHGVRVRVAAPAVSSVKLAGSGTITIEGLDGGELELTVAGSGDIVVTGEVDSLDASVGGSGDIDGSRLVSRSVRARIAGSGDIDVHATEALTATIAGSGEITYRGDPPSIERSIAGSGSISAR